jgi:hypothetical protein
MNISEVIRQKKQDIIETAKGLEKDYVVTVNEKNQVGSIHKNQYPTDGSIAIGKPLTSAEVDLSFLRWSHMEQM